MQGRNEIEKIFRLIKPLYYAILVLLVISVIQHIMNICNYETFISHKANKDITFYSYAATAQLFLRILGFIIYLVWFYRAYEYFRQNNLSDATTTSGMAIGYYFIPFVNIYKPFKTMEEVYTWNSLDSDEVSDTAIVSIWWALWIINLFVVRIALNLSESIAHQYVLLFSDLFEIAIFIIELVLITRITRWSINKNGLQSSNQVAP